MLQMEQTQLDRVLGPVLGCALQCPASTWQDWLAGVRGLLLYAVLFLGW